jgi:hypothetical protein
MQNLEIKYKKPIASKQALHAQQLRRRRVENDSLGFGWNGFQAHSMAGAAMAPVSATSARVRSAKATVTATWWSGIVLESLRPDICSRGGPGRRGGGLNLCRPLGSLPHGAHAEIFFRGGGDLIIFPKSNNSNVRTFAVRPSRKRFQTLAPSLCRPASSRGKTLRIYFPAGGGPSKVPSSRARTVGAHKLPRNSEKLFFTVRASSRALGCDLRGCSRKKNRREIQGGGVGGCRRQPDEQIQAR